jgi:hypothetical protein
MSLFLSTEAASTKKSVHPALLKAKDELKAKHDFMVEEENAAGHVETSGGVVVKKTLVPT